MPSPSTPEPEIVLAEEPHRRVVRVGDTIRRPLEPWADSIHALLDHLQHKGFSPAPRFLGVDDQGREMLSAIDGDAGPDGWAPVVEERGLRAMAQLLRRYHQAVADFDFDGLVFAGADEPARTDGAEPDTIVCHGDFGPWNLVWRDGEPIGMIDWDYASPQPPLHDVCYALEYVAPFRDDTECLRWLRYPEPPDRRRRIEIFTEAYGLPARPRLVEELVDGVIAQQREVRQRALRLAVAGHQPQRDWVRDGYLDTIDARIAWSIAWSEEHRDQVGAD